MIDTVEINETEIVTKKHRMDGYQEPQMDPQMLAEDKVLFLEQTIKILQEQISILTQKMVEMDAKLETRHKESFSASPNQFLPKDLAPEGLDREKSPVKVTSTTGTHRIHSFQAKPASRVAPPGAKPAGRTRPVTFNQSTTEDQWTSVGSKGKPVAPTSAIPVGMKSFKDILTGSTPESTLKKVLREPHPQEKCMEVATIQVKLQLTSKARTQPMVAWRAALKALKVPKILGISMLNPCQAELYLDKSLVPALEEILKPKGYLTESILTDKDVARRARDYLHGYFLPLRRAALEGLSLEQRTKTFKIIEELIQKLEPSKKKQWMYQLKMDQIWLSPSQEDSGMESDI
jgi:hypothetical protein